MAQKGVCVVGPTACGKTTLGVLLAKAFNGEVVSADSMQIYRGMTVGTAAPTEKEMDGVPHHMIAVADPAEQWSVARYVRMAVPIIDEILSRRGEDDDLYYYVKLDAAQLLLDNIDNTFVTPVFNGSASLRNAAGQLIEDVTKSVRRKETVDAAYMEKLYEKVSALYRLDSVGAESVTGKQDLGPLPSTAVFLLTALGVAWIGIGAVFVTGEIKKRRK